MTNGNGRRRDLPAKVDWGFLAVLIGSATISGLAVAELYTLLVTIWNFVTHT